MPKYYVSVLENKYVISADDPLSACVKVVKTYNIVTEDVRWKVSEQGFNFHKEDDWIFDSLIKKEIKGR